MGGASFGLLIVATSLFAFIDACVIQIVNPNSESGFTGLLLALVYVDATTLAAWSALYFAINYFLQLEEQTDRLLRLEAQAASAQLAMRSEEHTSELQSLMRISYAVFCLKKKNNKEHTKYT